MNEVKTTVEACRKFVRRALNLDAPLASTANAIRYHGFIQIDPIDVCGRMHDLILRNRVKDYCRNDLLATVYGPEPRQFFEQYIPGRLVALPIEAYRYLAPRMKKRRRSDGWGGALDSDQKRMASRILSRIREEGPLGAAAFIHPSRGMTGWGSNGTLSKITLDKLFFHGRLLISRRENFRRIYDLPERVLPGEVASAKTPTPTEIIRWHALLQMKQRRLMPLKGAQRKALGDQITEVKIDGQPTLYCLSEDAPLLAEAAGWRQSRNPLLLAPLDPLIYDRKTTLWLWDFSYIWEVYTPPTKRVRGYYALPVLAGTRLVGHVDPKAERTDQSLHTDVVISEDIKLKPALDKLTAFLGLKSWKTKPDFPKN